MDLFFKYLIVGLSTVAGVYAVRHELKTIKETKFLHGVHAVFLGTLMSEFVWNFLAAIFFEFNESVKEFLPTLGVFVTINILSAYAMRKKPQDD